MSDPTKIVINKPTDVGKMIKDDQIKGADLTINRLITPRACDPKVDRRITHNDLSIEDTKEAVVLIEISAPTIANKTTTNKQGSLTTILYHTIQNSINHREWTMPLYGPATIKTKIILAEKDWTMYNNRIHTDT